MTHQKSVSLLSAFTPSSTRQIDAYLGFDELQHRLAKKRTEKYMNAIAVDLYRYRCILHVILPSAYRQETSTASSGNLT